MIIGMLPASGSASRVRGIPKFCLPISDNKSLLEWHIDKMLEVCDEVRVCTRYEWIPILKKLNLDVKLLEIETSTMSDAILKMGSADSDRIIVGMPDVFISNSNGDNFYSNMVEKKSDVVLASWNHTENLRGKVGQIDTIGERVISIIDKNPKCNFPRMWGAIAFNNGAASELDGNIPVIGDQINLWIKNGYYVSYAECVGEYIDAGTFSGIKRMYMEV